MKHQFSKVVALAVSMVSTVSAFAANLKVGDTAPIFSTQTQDGTQFSLNLREGKWTVLYFYPKADTPGCTKQACAFRDHIEKIRAEGADVFGISSDSVADQSAFHKKYHLNFTLLADADGKIIELYGTNRPLLKWSKRWTFVIDPQLKIRTILKDVDPVKDSVRIAALIAELKAANTK